MKIRIIILVSILIAVAIGVHLAVYSPIAKDYSKVLADTNRMLEDYRKIIKEYDPEGITRETRNKKEDVLNQMKEYDRLRARYKLDKEVYQGGDRIEAVLALVNEIRQIEDNTKDISINVTAGWGLGAAFVRAKFGRGILATTDRYAIMPGEVRTFNRDEGTIEMWVQPQWNGYEETTNYFFMAYGVLEEGGPARQADISLYKEPKGTLQYVIRQGDGQTKTLMEPIDYWKKDEWHHIAVTWSKNKPEDVALYVDGRRATGLSSGYGGMGLGMGMGMEGMGIMPGMMPGMEMGLGMGMMPGMGMGMGNYGANRGRAQEKGLAPEVIDEIVVGADRYYLNAANSVIDEFRLSSIARSEFNLKDRPARDEFTMVLDRMEDHLFDPSLLSYLVQEMESKLRIIHDPATSPQLKREKQVQYDALRKTLSMDEGKLSAYDPTSAWIQRIYYCNQIAERLEGYSRERIRTILGFKWPSRTELDSLISFLELTREVLNKAIEQQIDEINRLEILGEATYLDETELKKFFDEEINRVMMEAGFGFFGMMPGMEA